MIYSNKVFWSNMLNTDFSHSSWNQIKKCWIWISIFCCNDFHFIRVLFQLDRKPKLGIGDFISASTAFKVFSKANYGSFTICTMNNLRRISFVCFKILKWILVSLSLLELELLSPIHSLGAWVVYKSSRNSPNLSMTSLSVSKLKNSYSHSRFENVNFWAWWPKMTS